MVTWKILETFNLFLNKQIPMAVENDVHFRNRAEAGQRLARLLEKYRGQEAVVYALPRGGVVVAKEIARELHCPLDLIIVRKIGHPRNPEFGIGAVTEAGRMFLNEAIVRTLDPKWLEAEIDKQQKEAQRRRELYLKDTEPVEVKGKTAIIVDDGIATGSTMFVAIKELRHRQPARIVVAVPVSPKDTAEAVKQEVDEFVAISAPDYFLGAIGAYYDDFAQVSDAEVISWLKDC